LLASANVTDFSIGTVIVYLSNEELQSAEVSMPAAGIEGKKFDLSTSAKRKTFQKFLGNLMQEFDLPGTKEVSRSQLENLFIAAGDLEDEEFLLRSDMHYDSGAMTFEDDEERGLQEEAW